MKREIIYITIFSFFLISFGCNSEKLSENETIILSNNFCRSLINLSAAIDVQGDKDSSISIINIILKDVDTNTNIKDSKTEILEFANKIISKKELPKLYSELKLKTLKDNLIKFESKEMTLIEEYHFVEKLFLNSYLGNWRCNDKIGFNVNVNQKDTIVLFEQREYHLPISIQAEENRPNPFQIISNSLQKDNKNDIYIKTEVSNKKVLKKVFEVKAYNRLSGEEFTEVDSFFIKVIKNR